MFFDNVYREWARHHSAPATTSIFFYGPFVARGEGFGFAFGIELADGLGGVFESRFVSVYHDLGHYGSDFATFATSGESVVDGLG